MAAAGAFARRRLWPLLVALTVSACGWSGDSALRWTSFEETACPGGSDAAQCFRLRAEVSATGGGRGRCEVVAVADNDVPLFSGAAVGPVSLSPGRTFEWLVELPAVDDPAFGAWAPRCMTVTSR